VSVPTIQGASENLQTPFDIQFFRICMIHGTNRQFHYRLILKLGKEMQINHYSKKEHTKISKIAKFGCEML
jgi:hypothetical protein